MSKKYKCFWCNKRFVDLEKHTKNMHPKLTPRSYDYNKEINERMIFIDPEILDITRGITYRRATLTRWEKIKIYFRIMQEPPRVRVEPTPLYDLIPKVKAPKFKYNIGSIT